ncbi:MAG: hypothetical protein HamCj_19070 [Candidatus Hamiltonella defensa (Ceratovacuna japonica)]|nr:phosphopantetheine-binding protein [Candidatus Hamiltonella defensa]
MTINMNSSFPDGDTLNKEQNTTHQMRREARIRDILIDCLGCNEEDITPEKHLVDDLYADSVALIDMVIMISEKFKIEMTEKDFMHINTVKDLYRWTENHFQ